ncbi:sensor histidine kinase [Cellulomonas triticagri]|uniref:sensor histidine kinase n=1 Tax=Cellulomonas triticagri TaxID=2483352 RepID=UPI001315317A|nr:histidine kinase [Cellulomonas triticagri]
MAGSTTVPGAGTARVARAGAALRRTTALGAGGRPTGAQLALTVAWLGGMYWTAAVRTGTWEAPDTALLTAVVGAWAPLLLRTWRPVLALVGTLAAETTILVYLPVATEVAQVTGGMGAYQPAPLATMLAVATLAGRVPARVGWTAGLVAGTWLGSIGYLTNSRSWYLADLVVFYVVVTAAAAGVWRSGRRERARRLAAEREERTQRAVLDERLRIARELHDVLAHNLTLVNAQAGVARYLMRTDPVAAERALGDIAQHTGRAIDELRSTIGLLRRRDEDDDPASDPNASLAPVPGFGALDDLVAGLASVGVQVDLTRTGTPVPLAQHADLAAYRIAQEALTNASKHAAGSVVQVAVGWTSAGLRLRVTNPLPPAGHPAAPGTGNGLIGMHERAAAAGGTLRAGPGPGDLFEVVAVLPADLSPATPTTPARTTGDQTA